MSPETKWEELLLYKLEGARFDAHDGIELRDLRGLYHLREALLVIAKADFRNRLDRRVPKGAEDLLDIRVRAFEDGCIQARLFLARPVPIAVLPPMAQGRLFGSELSPNSPTPEDEFLNSVHRAASLVQMFLSEQREQTLPSWMPPNTYALLRDSVPHLRSGETLSIIASRTAPTDLLHTGRTIEDPAPAATAAPNEPLVDEQSSLEYDRLLAARTATARGPWTNGEEFVDRGEYLGTAPQPPTSQPLVEALPPIAPRADETLRERLERLADQERRDRAEAERRTATRKRVLEGEVRAADLDDNQATLAMADGTRVRVAMTQEHEKQVTTSLNDHERVRLRVVGLAVHTPTGHVRMITAERVAVVQPPDPEAPSEQLFERLASEDPDRLIRLLIPEGLAPHLLTYAAEVAGRELAADRVVAPLLLLLDHPEAVVREGAIHGLAHHAEDEQVLKRIAELVTSDPSRGVRVVADGVVKGHGR